MQNTADDFISTDCLDLTHLFKFFKHMAWICQQMSILCVDGGEVGVEGNMLPSPLLMATGRGW